MKQNKNLDKKLQNLEEMMTILFSSDIDFFIFHGTLLGYHRERNVISYDNDVDIMIDIRDREKLMVLGQEMAPFGYRPNNKSTHDFIQLVKGNKSEPEGHDVDFYLYENNPNESYIVHTFDSRTYGFQIRIPKKIIFPLTTGTMQNIPVKIPNDVDACCRFCYGDSYMTPCGPKALWMKTSYPESRSEATNIDFSAPHWFYTKQNSVTHKKWLKNYEQQNRNCI